MKQFCCCRWHLSVFLPSLSTINSDFVCFFFSFIYFLAMPVGVAKVMSVLALTRTAKLARVLVIRLYQTWCWRKMKRNMSNIWSICQFLRYCKVFAWFRIIFHDVLFLSTKCRRKIINGASFSEKLYKARSAVITNSKLFW